MTDSIWANERSHEAYAKNYSIVFPHDESLSGRNLNKDPFHEVIILLSRKIITFPNKT